MREADTLKKKQKKKNGNITKEKTKSETLDHGMISRKNATIPVISDIENESHLGSNSCHGSSDAMTDLDE